MELLLDRTQEQLSRSDGLKFDLRDRCWKHSEKSVSGDSVTVQRAVAWLQRETEYPCGVPVGVIGPREADQEEWAAGVQVGALLAEIGLTVLCGGRQGVMEAVCLGVKQKSGLSIGLLPDEHLSAANPYVTVPIATGIGVSRNVIIARASLCLVAIGGGYGTISEAAFGLQFEKKVLGIGRAPNLPGLVACEDAYSAVEHVARIVLSLE